MIPLGHNRTNGAVYSKINIKVQICSGHYIHDSHPMLHSYTVLFENSKLNPNNHVEPLFP